jgi:curved DNA-binding protein CbpA
MIDAFAEFSLPRSPGVDEQALARRFDDLSRSCHPDAGGDPAAFSRLTEARRLLSSPALRLRHLLELESPGTRLDGPLSPSLMDLFTTLGPTLQAVQNFELRKTAATSALARALLASEETRHRESLEDLASTLATQFSTLLDAAQNWNGSPDPLAAWAREAAFLEKWQSQVRDHLSRLTL